MSDLVTIVGTVVKEDPILRFTNNGTPLCEFGVRVAGKRAKGDQPATEAVIHNIVCWRELAENVAESLHKTDRVIVQGAVSTDTWKAQDGSDKTRNKLTAYSVGVDLNYATATVDRSERKETVSAAPQGSYATF